MILNLILYASFIYIAVYGFFRIILALRSFSVRRFLSEKRPSNNPQKKLCILIYANAKTENLFELLNSIDMQTYPKSLYQTHVIYQNPEEPLPEYIYCAKVHNVTNPEFFGKDKSFSFIISKLLENQCADTFIFLGVNRKINSDFLMNVATYPDITGVMSGRNDIYSKVSSLKANIFSARQKFINNTVKLARAVFGLYGVIDSENCSIDASILQRIHSVSIENKDKELKYSALLASAGFPVVYNPYMRTFINVKDYKFSTTSLKGKFSTFWYFLQDFVQGNWRFKEFMLSLFAPCAFVELFLYLVMAYFSFKFFFQVEFKTIVYLGFFLFMGFILNWLNSRLSPKESFYMGFFPFSAVFSKLKDVFKKISLKEIKRQKNEEVHIEQATIEIWINDGKKNRRCNLDLISEEGMSRAVVRFKKKKLVSDGYLRMYDAIFDLIGRIREKGLQIRICQNCCHFISVPDGSVNQVKGICSHHIDIKTGNNLPTLIWNTCRVYKPAEASDSVIKQISDEMDES